ncbi:MAG: TIGR02391 family protein [Thermoguttaceae bacterium]
MAQRKCLSPAILEEISKILGDTAAGITGSEIGRFLQQGKIVDVSPEMTKYKRLYNAFATEQNQSQQSNKILCFIQLVMQPARYVDNPALFNARRQSLNRQLSFAGYELLETGKFTEVEAATTISDARQRAELLKNTLQTRGTHHSIFHYCKEELLKENYFHAIFEAVKGLFHRIRELSGVSKDGTSLIEEVFRQKNPILIINNFQTDSEKNEHNGFRSMLIGLVGVIRNPSAHELKIYWELPEQDALDLFGLLSYCNRRLDKAQKIRQP